jgi:hypothetical protein
MAGRRMLCQSLNAEFSPKGIHVAHILIDGAVDAPDTLGKILGPEKFQQLRESRGTARIRRAKRIDLPQAGHLIPGERPAELADLLIQFAQEV